MNIKKYLKPNLVLEKIKIVIKNIPSYMRTIYLFASFFLLLIFFLIEKIYKILEKIPYLGKVISKLGQFWTDKFSRKLDLFIERLETNRQSKVRRIYLIELAYRNMMIKKTRSFITIFGMSVGVGAIVLLLSLGYGIEKLIISKVAGLNELKMIDISAGENTTLRLNEAVFNKINKIKEKNMAMPIISVVGRINYNRAQTDVLAYAVPKDYLINGINTKFLKGKPFANNASLDKKLSWNLENNGQVAGLETKIEPGIFGKKIVDDKISFNLDPENPQLKVLA